MKATSRKQLIKELAALDPDNADKLKLSEDFAGKKGGIWTSGEGSIRINGNTAFDYWELQENRGVHPAMEIFLRERGWFAEWYDAGTIFLWRI